MSHFFCCENLILLWETRGVGEFHRDAIHMSEKLNFKTPELRYTPIAALAPAASNFHQFAIPVTQKTHPYLTICQP